MREAKALHITDYPSPNQDDRPDGTVVDMLLLHYTGMQSAAAALQRLCDPAAEVSVHYLIGEDGGVLGLVPEDRRAWHAGVGAWRGATDLNARSIGIELVNPGHEFGYRPFPEPQMAALETLATEIIARHAIAPARVLGHSDVAPARKQDPGELFDWARLAGRGVGLWPAADFTISANAPALAPGAQGAAVVGLKLALAVIGYPIEGGGVYDPDTVTVVAAFQRHFRPAQVDGIADSETAGLVHHLAARSG